MKRSREDFGDLVVETPETPETPETMEYRLEEGAQKVLRDEQMGCVMWTRPFGFEGFLDDPMDIDTDPSLEGDLDAGDEFWNSLTPDAEEFFMFADMFQRVPQFVQEREFWGPERDPIVPDAVKGSVIFNKLNEFVKHHTARGHQIVTMDVLNWTRGYPKDNMNLLFDEIHQQIAHNPHRRFILVIRRTDSNTIRLLTSDPLVNSCSTIFNVSPCGPDGALISGDDVLDINAWNLMGAGFSLQDETVTHASVGADDYVLVWMRHYFGLQIITRENGDQYRDINILAVMFRGIPFVIQVLDCSTGDYKVFRTTLESN
jgi:hypothetical protein